MSDKPIIPMQTIQFPGLPNPYRIPTQPEHVGAAPAGYGIGENIGKICTDCNEALRDGFYTLKNALNAPYCDNIPGYDFSNGASLLVENSETKTYQTVKLHEVTAKRSLDKETDEWSEWGFDNFPLWFSNDEGQPGGKTWKTTKTYEGKTVFCVTWDLGQLPNALESEHGVMVKYVTFNGDWVLNREWKPIFVHFFVESIEGNPILYPMPYPRANGTFDMASFVVYDEAKGTWKFGIHCFNDASNRTAKMYAEFIFTDDGGDPEW